MNKAIQAIAALLQAETWKMAIGTGTNPAWIDNQSLQTEIDRQDVIPTLETTNLLNDTLVFDGTFAMADPTNLSELGLFLGAPTAILFCRITFTPITIPAGFPLPIKVKVVVVR